MRRRIVGATRFVGLLATAVLVLEMLPAAHGSSQQPPPAPPSTSAGTPGRPGPGSKLTPRLAELAKPEVQALPASQRANRLSLPPQGPGSLMERGGGRVLVYVRVTDTGPDTENAIRGAGARIVHTAARYGVVTAEVAPGQLTALAAVPNVVFLEEVLAPALNGTATGLTARVHAQQGCAPATTSEGDTQLRADLARASFSVDGTGVKVGVLSDSYDTNTSAPTHAADDVATGDLPGTGNPCGQTTPVTVQADYSGGTDEGRAMLQVVHDLAPGAQLAFATAFNGEFDFADQIRALQTWGANVIVDDISYFDEPFFQDGPVSVATSDVTAAGATYFSSAGNSNEIVAGHNVASYEAPAFRSTPCPSTIPFGETSCHNFDPSGGTDSGWDFTLATGGRISVDFQYSEPWNGVGDDFDIFLLDATTNTVLAGSVIDNLTSQKPFESFGYTWSGSPTNMKLVIGRFSGTGNPRLKMVLLQSSSGLSNIQYNTSSGGDIVGPTIFGHNGAANAGSTAAVPYNDSTTPESYTSRGPLTLYWGPVSGSTPAPPLGSPQVLNKPDFAATDGGRNTFFGQLVSGVWRFFGTSQAAPHAAAVAALLRQFRPDLTPPEVLAELHNTARPVTNGGTPDAVGGGLIDAYGALADAHPPTPGFYTPLTPARILDTRTPIGGHQSPLGQGASMDLTVTGQGGVPASGVSAVVLNVTATDTTANSFLTVWPTGTTRPNASNLNWPPGTTIPNLVQAHVGAGGKVSFFNNAGSTNVIADVVGWYSEDSATGAGYSALTPARILDTRTPIGGHQSPLDQGGSLDLTVTGQGGVPPSGVSAVVLNVTATDTTANSFLTVWPSGATRPNVSNLNWPPQTTIPNLVVVKVGTGGQVSFFNNAGSVNVVADVVGWYANDSSTGHGFTSLTPARVLDTRTPIGGHFGPLGQGGSFNLTVTGVGGVPAAGVSAVVLNVTVTNTNAASFLTLWPAGGTQPNVSNLNWAPGVTIPNLVVVGVGSANQVSIFNNAGNTDVIADVVGWF